MFNIPPIEKPEKGRLAAVTAYGNSSNNPVPFSRQNGDTSIASASGTRVTIKVAGHYVIEGVVPRGRNGTGGTTSTARIYVNGSQRESTTGLHNNWSISQVSVRWSGYLKAGDYVELRWTGGDVAGGESHLHLSTII